MAYKFFTGALNTSGTLNVENAITGNAVRIDGAEGLVLTNGNIVASAAQLTASAVSASSAQFGSVAVSVLSAPNLDLTGYLNVDGAIRLGNGDTQATTISGSTTNDILVVKADVDVARISKNNGLQVLAGNISGSGQLQVGNNASIAGTLQVTNSTTLNTTTINGQLNANGAVNLGNGDTDLIKVSGSTTNDIFVVAADFDVLKVSKNNGVQAFGALSGSSTLQAGGNATIGGTLTVNGATISGTRLNLGQDGGTISISGSGQAQFGGAGTFAGNLTVNGISTTVVQLTASQSTLGAARVSSLSSSGNVIVAGDLQVNGTTTYINSTNLTVTDKKVVLATGSVNAVAANEAGIYIGNDDGSEYASFAYDGNNDSWDLKSVNGLNLSGSAMGIKIDSTTVVQKTALFAGAVTGSSAGIGLRLAVAAKTADYTVVLSDYVIAVDTAAAVGAVNITLPSATEVGRVYLVKDVGGQADTKNVTILRAGTDTIDGGTQAPLNSQYAAVSVVCVASGKWSLF